MDHMPNLGAMGSMGENLHSYVESVMLNYSVVEGESMNPNNAIILVFLKDLHLAVNTELKLREAINAEWNRRVELGQDFSILDIQAFAKILLPHEEHSDLVSVLFP